MIQEKQILFFNQSKFIFWCHKTQFSQKISRKKKVLKSTVVIIKQNLSEKDWFSVFSLNFVFFLSTCASVLSNILRYKLHQEIISISNQPQNLFLWVWVREWKLVKRESNQYFWVVRYNLGLLQPLLALATIVWIILSEFSF